MKNFFTFLLLLAGLGLGANNLQIKNVSLVDNDTVAKTVMIRFDISWDHSWRDEINWDAAWVFAKYFDGGKPYHHCKLSLGGEMSGTGTPHELIVPNDSLELDGTYYGVGAFIYRSELSDGTFNADSVILKWNYGLNGFETLPEDIELHVYGTEMVYIPEGPFAFGDGDGENMSGSSWHLKDSPDYVYIGDYLAPLMIHPSGDDQAKNTGIRVHGKEGLDWDGDGNIDNPRFPTGYKAFYMMKYETTQGQYTDFLNSLTEYQISSANLFWNGTPDKRYAITFENGKYVCFRPDRSCNYIQSKPSHSISDWMGLRPLSELEYEKASRGPLNPVVNEYAWGSKEGMEITAIEGEENGTEIPFPENANYHYSFNNLSGGDGGNGPVRVGIFARENTNRITSGCSYYGVMDLTGNLCECMVLIIDNNIYDRGFQDFQGDGEISEDGKANSFLNLTPDGSYFNDFFSIENGRFFVISTYIGSSYGFTGARFNRTAPELP